MRIEMWDDEVDSIRTFDVESQRSVEQLDQVTIYPASEVVLSEENSWRLGLSVWRRRRRPVRRRSGISTRARKPIGSRPRWPSWRTASGEGWRTGGLDAYLRYFADDTVSFLDYFPEESSILFLDEPARLMEKGETVELEFRESMMHRLEKGVSAARTDGITLPGGDGPGESPAAAHRDADRAGPEASGDEGGP